MELKNEKIQNSLTQDDLAKLANKSFAIIDPSSVIRSQVMGILKNLVPTASSYIGLKTFEESVVEIQAADYLCVISEFDIKDHTIFDLIKSLKEAGKKLSETLFFIVTKNNSEASIVQSAEEDIAGYILKPFSLDQLTQRVTQTIKEHLNPSPYAKKIREAKIFIDQGDFLAAKNSLFDSLAFSARPSLSQYYLARICMHEGDFEEAKNNLITGLRFNKSSYQCLSYLFEILYEKKDYDSAYKVFQQITSYFPVTNDKLVKAVRIILSLGMYSEFPSVFSLYQKVEEPNRLMMKTMSSALYIYGKHLMSEGKSDLALNYFLESISNSYKDIKLMLSISSLYFDLGEKENVKKISSLINETDKHQRESKVMFFLGDLDKEQMTNSTVIECKKLLSDKACFPIVYEVLIKCYLSMNDLENARKFYEQAEDNLEQKETEFTRIKQLKESVYDE